MENVALLAEGVDRNRHQRCWSDYLWLVALLAEGVDRNKAQFVRNHLGRLVALLAEGVDRNFHVIQTVDFVLSRPPRGGRG